MRLRLWPFPALAFGVIFAMLQLAASLASPFTNVDGDESWAPIATGIEFRKFELPDPNNVYVARMDRNNLNVTIDGMIAQGRLSGGTETVSSMFNRYEDTINFWGERWGNRNDVVVAINGYFYGSPFEPPGVPWRGQIHSGWYAKRHDDLQSGSGFAWKLNRQAFIGECVFHPSAKQQINVTGSTTLQLLISDINIQRGEDQLILYTPQYDTTTKTDDDGVEVLIEMTRPTLILPFDAGGSFPTWAYPAFGSLEAPQAEALGVVRGVFDGQGSTPIPFDHVVLSAAYSDSPENTLAADLKSLKLGDQVAISQSVTHFPWNTCQNPTLTNKDWTKTYASIGGSFHFLENGVITTFSEEPQATVRDARTAIAFNDQFVFFIVVDQIILNDDPGENGAPNDPSDDIVILRGMSIAELAQFARDTLGATFGIAQDGGGSSTMVVNGKVVNVPNDWDSDISLAPCEEDDLLTPTLTPTTTGGTPIFLPLVNQSGPTPTPSSTLCFQGTQRAVANGMMMVVVQPRLASTAFTVGQSLQTTANANLRLGPGTNYAVLTTIPASSEGTIVASSDKHNGLNMNGVFATGTYWWRVKFGAQTGWMSESLLTPIP